MLLLALRNTPVNPSGFTLAVYPNKTLVNEAGTQPLSDGAYAAFELLVDEVEKLPAPETFRSTWRVKTLATSMPIERLFVRGKEVCVQGYAPGRTTLTVPVGEYTTLPGCLCSLLDLIAKY